jgi:hypothetical protein
MHQLRRQLWSRIFVQRRDIDGSLRRAIDSHLLPSMLDRLAVWVGTILLRRRLRVMRCLLAVRSPMSGGLRLGCGMLAGARQLPAGDQQ